VGLIGESISEKLEDLKQGRNRVIEEGHTLVIGCARHRRTLARTLALTLALTLTLTLTLARWRG
jgi:hypothetical protein